MAYQLPSNNSPRLSGMGPIDHNCGAMGLPRLPPSRRMMRFLAMLASLPNVYAYAVSPAAGSPPRFAPHRCASSARMAEKPQSLSQVRVDHLPRPVPG